jgi:RNA polymerase sigma-70 factor (ECF subfamily)
MKDTIAKNSSQDSSRYEEFLSLFRTNEDRIFGFILTFLPNLARAEDILQETMIIMWRKFGEFEAGTNFGAWGIKIARFNLYKYHRSEQSNIVHFDSDALEVISQHVADTEETKNNMHIEALLHCFEKLEKKNKQIILLKYENNFKIEDISKNIGKSIRDTYRILARIQHALQKCAFQTLKAWELHS